MQKDMSTSDFVKEALFFYENYNNFYQKRGKIVRRETSNIVDFCFPKSGSRRLVEVIANLDGFSERYLNPSHGMNDEEALDVYFLLLNCRSNYICHSHSHFYKTLNFIIRHFDLKIILQTRNVFDALCSNRDHIQKWNHASHLATVPPDFGDWDIERQNDFVIDYIAPWYFKFYASWELGVQEEGLNVSWVDFQDLIADTFGIVKHVFEELEIPVDDEALRNSVGQEDKKKSNFNIGAGRNGREEFSESQVVRIEKLSTYYPCSFERIGIG